MKFFVPLLLLSVGAKPLFMEEIFNNIKNLFTREKKIEIAEWNSSSDAVLEIEDITGNAKNNTFTLWVAGNLKKEIERGVVTVEAQVGKNLTLFEKTFDLCTDIIGNSSEYTCPVPAGPFDFSISFEIPQKLPPANFNLKITCKDGDTKIFSADLLVKYC
ncbi:MAG: phosphatidylglycerol/phosphatidylinositol transfer protein [Amphiamblys sp. WSBS2006]|nr:MAG: phosphatidylglycerol/phosphatidylinositol transfer protein [Amphiamblys sp. WSBS2006]